MHLQRLSLMDKKERISYLKNLIREELVVLNVISVNTIEISIENNTSLLCSKENLLESIINNEIESFSFNFNASWAARVHSVNENTPSRIFPFKESIEVDLNTFLGILKNGRLDYLYFNQDDTELSNLKIKFDNMFNEVLNS